MQDATHDDTNTLALIGPEGGKKIQNEPSREPTHTLQRSPKNERGLVGAPATLTNDTLIRPITRPVPAPPGSEHVKTGDNGFIIHPSLPRFLFLFILLIRK